MKQRNYNVSFSTFYLVEILGTPEMRKLQAAQGVNNASKCPELLLIGKWPINTIDVRFKNTCFPPKTRILLFSYQWFKQQARDKVVIILGTSNSPVASFKIRTHALKPGLVYQTKLRQHCETCFLNMKKKLSSL